MCGKPAAQVGIQKGASMRKLLFIYNVHAGKGLLKGKLAAVLEALVQAGWEIGRAHV